MPVDFSHTFWLFKRESPLRNARQNGWLSKSLENKVRCQTDMNPQSQSIHPEPSTVATDHCIRRSFPSRGYYGPISDGDSWLVVSRCSWLVRHRQTISQTCSASCWLQVRVERDIRAARTQWRESQMTCVVLWSGGPVLAVLLISRAVAGKWPVAGGWFDRAKGFESLKVLANVRLRSQSPVEGQSLFCVGPRLNLWLRAR